MVATHGGNPALRNGLFPLRQLALILRVGILNAADGGYAHAVQISASLGGVALKIAVQRALLLGNSQLISRLCKVVHADVQVSGVQKLKQAGAKDLELLQAFG